MEEVKQILEYGYKIDYRIKALQIQIEELENMKYLLQISIQELKDPIHIKAMELLIHEGKTPTDISHQLYISRSQVYKIKKKLEEIIKKKM